MCRVPRRLVRQCAPVAKHAQASCPRHSAPSHPAPRERRLEGDIVAQVHVAVLIEVDDVATVPDCVARGREALEDHEQVRQINIAIAIRIRAAFALAPRRANVLYAASGTDIGRYRIALCACLPFGRN